LRDYALIWKYVSEARAGGRTGKSLARLKVFKSPNILPSALIKMILDDAKPADVIAAAADPDTRHQRENECIAYFFMGQLSLINGDTKAAAEYFQKTLATGVTNFRQYTAARVELERIQK